MILTALFLSVAMATQIAPPAIPQASVQTPPVSQPTQNEGPVTDLGAVTVTGQRPTEERATAFVEEVTAPPRGRGLARWDKAICVGTANIDNRYAQFMIDRISATAASVGLDIGEPGCRANVMIAASTDADALAKALVRDEPNGFRPSTGQTDIGSQALSEFQNSDAPVRWWHVSLPVSVDTGDVAVRVNGEEPPTVYVRDASRLRSNVRDDLVRVVIILDTSRMGPVSYGALSDYVAMIALAQIDAKADTSTWPTILNLFAANPPNSLTNWDKDYLTALYAARRDRLRGVQQTRDIVHNMVDGVPSPTADRDDEDPAEITPTP
ncbi:hypothetical protein BH10PSE1_BH10PSE1_17860 [soil metagenome]